MIARTDATLRTRLASLEREAIVSPWRHRLRIGLVAALGYLYPAIMMLAALTAVITVLASFPWMERIAQGEPIIILVWLGLLAGALFLVGSVLHACTLRYDEPEGEKLGTAPATPLHALVEEVRGQVGGPAIHEIRITPDLNASIWQQGSRAMVGPRHHVLSLGLPLLASFTPAELRIVLAHEFGHLCGGHGRMGPWIHGIFQSWQNLSRTTSNEASFSGRIFRWFLTWYPTMLAENTVVARHLQELDADRTSLTQGDARAVGRALVLVEWYAHRLQSSFWPEARRLAVADPLPPPDILERMRAYLAAPVRPERFANWCRRQRIRQAALLSTHPSLLTRLRSLGCPEVLDELARGEPPAAPAAESSALTLLGDCWTRHEEVADRTWKAFAIHEWRARHHWAKEMRRPRPPSEEAGGEVDPRWRDLEVELCFASDEDGARMLREFVQLHPTHAAARFALGQKLVQMEDDAAIEHLEIAAASDDHALPALEMILEYFRNLGRDHEADRIRARFESRGKALEERERQRREITVADELAAPQLSLPAQERVLAVLRFDPRVARAWLVRRRPTASTSWDHVLVLDRAASWLGLDTSEEAALLEDVRSRLPPTIAPVTLKRGERTIRRRLQRLSSAPFYERRDR